MARSLPVGILAAITLVYCLQGLVAFRGTADDVIWALVAASGGVSSSTDKSLDAKRTSLSFETSTDVVQAVADTRYSTEAPTSGTESFIDSLFDANGRSVFMTPTTGDEGFDRFTVVAQLSGEMCNNIGFIAYAHAIAIELLENHSIHTRIVLRHQERPKWKRAAQAVRKCFPKARNWDFEEGNRINGAHFTRMLALCKKSGLESLLFTTNRTLFHEGTQAVANMLQRVPFAKPESSTSPVSHPFITIPNEGIALLQFYPFLERYEAYFRRLFSLDKQTCCKELPEPGEIVFHFRNFRQELSQKFDKFDFDEIQPRLLVRYILHDVPKEKSVAILSRFSTSPFVQGYVTELEQHGLHPRVIFNQSGEHDFCFLYGADTIVGAARSTYFVWAGILGQATHIYPYSINSTITRRVVKERYIPLPLDLSYDFQDPALKARWQFSLHEQEENDADTPAPKSDYLQSKNMANVHTNESFSSCLLWMDDNHRMPEWLAYHYFALPLRHLVIAVDPHSSTSLQIHKRWHSLINITVWSDSDFVKSSLARSDGDSKNTLKDKHRARQSQFYQACTRLLHDSNQTLTVYHDVDEFLTISDEFDSTRTAKAKTLADKSQPGHVLHLIRTYNSASMNASKTRQELSRSCFHAPRALYSAVESSEDERRADVPDWLDPVRFETLRFRYRHTRRGSKDGIGKAIIDVSQVTTNDVDAGGRTHRPLTNVCQPDTASKSYGSFPLGIHHYLGSWESYSFRDDARKGTLRSRATWEERSTKEDGGPDDEIRPWIQGFVNLVGAELARELLRDAGLKNASKGNGADLDGWRR